MSGPVPDSLDPVSAHPPGFHRFLTWRNAVRAGVAAALLLGASVAGYLTMWSTGVGPVGSLVAQGVIEEGDRVVLADFDDSTGEELGSVVSGALGVDLAESGVLDLVDLADLAPALRRMRVEPGAPLTSAVARELAVREGIEAVLEGSVARAGSGYVVVAALLEAQTGRSIASFRVSAADDTEIIDAIDALSQDIREKAGESLREIRGGEPLAQATTASLDALRAFTEADRLFATTETGRARDLLERAVALDSTFAQAWLQLAFHHSNSSTGYARADEAFENAFRYRELVPEAARYLIEGAYHSWNSDLEASIEAYQNLLRVRPESGAGLNNLANGLSAVGEWDEARELRRRAAALPSRSSVTYGNLVTAELFFGDVEAANLVATRLEDEYPDYLGLDAIRIAIALLAGAPDRAEQIASALLDDATLPALIRVTGAVGMTKVAYRRGQLVAARAYAERAVELAERVDPTFGSFHRIFAALGETLFIDPERGSDVIRDGLFEGVIDPDALPEEMAASFFTLLSDDDLDDVVENLDLSARVEAFAAATQRLRLEMVDQEPREKVTSIRRFFRCETEHCLRLLLGMLAVEEQDWELAIELLEPIRGSELDILTGLDDVYAMLNLGPAYEGVGRNPEAIAAYQRIIDLWADADEEGRVTVRRFEERVRALTTG